MHDNAIVIEWCCQIFGMTRFQSTRSALSILLKYGSTRCQTFLFVQVGFAILGFISGSVGLRGKFVPEGNNKDTVKVHNL